MNSISSHQRWNRLRRFAFLALLATVPACGLSEYEARMIETQKRADHFYEESKYLDEPVKMPIEKDKDGKEKSLANVFFRPPKGIDATPQPRNDPIWRYNPRKDGSNFAYVEMAFAQDDKDFVTKVLNNYPPQPRQAQTSLPFDRWEFNDGGFSYSVNISKSGPTKIAIVYVFATKVREQANKAIELSLRSLAVDQQIPAARLKYAQKSPWQLKNKAGE